MPRVKSAVSKLRSKKRLMKRAKGNVGGRSRLLTTARDTVRRGQAFAFAHRRKKKGDFRRLWITRLSAACRMRGGSYSRFISALNKANIGLDRKTLSELAIRNPEVFDKVWEMAMQG